MNVLICDDQQSEANRLSTLLMAEQCAENGFDIKTVQFTAGQALLDHIRCGAHADVCFLDIFMPEMNGIQLAECLRSQGFRGEIVFLTTSNDFAHQSYQVNAFDYLLKPPTPQSIRRIVQALEEKFKTADKKGLHITTQGAVNFILYRNISHIEVLDHIVYIRLINNDEIKVYTTFSEIARQLLSDSRFIQCHRSYIVNMSDIEVVTEGQVIMQNGAKIPISRGFSPVKKEMIKWMFEGGK